MNRKSSFYTEPHIMGKKQEIDQNNSGRIFLKWEKLRLIYIGVLLILIFAIFHHEILNYQYRVYFKYPLIKVIIFVNVAYFAGPIAEYLFMRKGYKNKWITLILFLSGTGFAGFISFAILLDAALGIAMLFFD
jgi:hypothetical protein